MGFRLVARSLVVATCVAGCAAIAGIGETSDQGVAGDAASRDALSPSPEGGATTDAAPCKATTAPLPTGPLRARRAAIVPDINGAFDDWACVDRIAVGLGAISKDMPTGVAQSLDFALQWTPEALFFYAHAVTAPPGGTGTGDQIFRNDSVHLFLGHAPPAANGLYQPGDHQLTFDYAGHLGDYSNGQLTPNKVNARGNATTGGTGPVDFQIEARVDAASLGVGAFASGQSYFVNVQLIDAKSDGSGQVGVRVWRLPAACPCKVGCCEVLVTKNSPTCDLHCMESLQLE